MLEVRPNCECCDADLAADTSGAPICSFECTFCAACGERLAGKCPNCDGALVARPVRSTAALGKYPASQKRVLRASPCF